MNWPEFPNRLPDFLGIVLKFVKTGSNAIKFKLISHSITFMTGSDFLKIVIVTGTLFVLFGEIFSSINTREILCGDPFCTIDPYSQSPPWHMLIYDLEKFAVEECNSFI